MATRQDSGASTHSTRSTSSQRSASAKQVGQPEPQVIIETKSIDPPARAILRRIFTLFLVIGVLRFLFPYVLLPWKVNPDGIDPSELQCVINHQTDTHPGFLYCNRDCVPRLHNQEKITAFNAAHPHAVNYTIQRLNMFRQSTKYCISAVELDLVWLPLKLQQREREWQRLRKGNHDGPWRVLI